MKEVNKKEKIPIIAWFLLVIFGFYWIYTKSFSHAVVMLLVAFWFIGVPWIYASHEKLSLLKGVGMVLFWIIVQLIILFLFGGDICNFPFYGNAFC